MPPAYRQVVQGVTSLAVPASRIAAKLGRPFDDEQYAACDDLTQLTANGTPATLFSTLIAPRQNIKTWLYECVALCEMLRPRGPQLGIWSAHVFDTAKETFNDLCNLIEDHSWLADQVTKIEYAHGKEAITFQDKRRLKFKARSAGGGRGLAGDVVFLDEGFALTPAHMGSLMPIMSTRDNARMYIGSSAGLAQSGVLRGFRDGGRTGKNRAAAYVEFCGPGTFVRPGCAADDCSHIFGDAIGCVLDNEQYWMDANIAAKYGRISKKYLRSERQTLDWHEYARERLGWWDDPVEAETLLPLWKATLDRESVPLARPVGFALDISRGLSNTVIAAAGFRADGLPHVEVIRADAGYDWVVEYLQPKVWDLGIGVRILGGTATARSLIPMFKKAHIPVIETTLPDYCAATGLFIRELALGRLRHLDDKSLWQAVNGATTVNVGKVGVSKWSAKEEKNDITPLVAATLARWELEQQPISEDDGNEFG